MSEITISDKNTNRRPGRTRRRVLRVVGGFVVFITAVLATFFIAVQCSRKPYTSPDTTGWQTGDIFFSSGNSWRSLCVRLLGGESTDEVTHCGFVVIEDGKPRLVHMSTDKDAITMEDVDDYGKLNDCYKITARRLTVPVDTVALRRNLMKLIEDGKGFDNDFDHTDSDKYYCTELIIRVLEHQGIYVFDPLLDKDFVYPADLESSPFVEKIQTR